MGQVPKNSSDKQEEPAPKKYGAGWCIKTGAPVVLGLIVALITAWWILPYLFFIKKEQPVAFTHASHTKIQDCASCHFLRTDGSFNAIPDTEQCASCHTDRDRADMQEMSQEEAEYIEKYVAADKEVPWLVHQKQPDHVFFSHAAHMQPSCQQLGCHAEYTDANALCAVCHPGEQSLDSEPYFENRITRYGGYSKNTMKMQECKSCHLIPNHMEMAGADLACYTCHK
jgi:hypothetical protein